jgi:hypothetical protein
VDANGNPLLALNKGNSDQDIRHSFVFASMYELPFGKGKQLGNDIPKGLDYIIGGWQWNNIITLQTGTPIDLNVPGIVGQTDRPDVSGYISAKIVHGATCGASANACGVISGNFAAPPVSGGN